MRAAELWLGRGRIAVARMSVCPIICKEYEIGDCCLLAPLEHFDVRSWWHSEWLRGSPRAIYPAFPRAAAYLKTPESV